MVSFTSRLLNPCEKVPVTYYMGCWVDPRKGLNAVVKSLLPMPGIKPRFLDISASILVTIIAEVFLLLR
jgi:hypothetical protein